MNPITFRHAPVPYSVGDPVRVLPCESWAGRTPCALPLWYRLTADDGSTRDHQWHGYQEGYGANKSGVVHAVDRRWALVVVSCDGTDLNRGVYHVSMLEPPAGSALRPVCTCPILVVANRGCRCGAMPRRKP